MSSCLPKDTSLLLSQMSRTTALNLTTYMNLHQFALKPKHAFVQDLYILFC